MHSRKVALSFLKYIQWKSLFFIILHNYAIMMSIVYDVINDVITIEVYGITMKCLSQYRLLVFLNEHQLEAKNQTNYPTMTSLITSRLSNTHKCDKIASIVVWTCAKSHIQSINIDKQKIHV